MGGIFLKLLNMSITAGWLILAVLGIRLVFRKIPKLVNCLLWGLVAVRLICPFSIESQFSMLPSTEPIKSSAMVEGEVHNYIPSIDSNLTIVENTINPMLTETFTYDESESVAPLPVLTDVADIVWLCGLILAVIYVMGSMIRLRRLVSEAVCVRDNIYICDAVKSPFILGIVRPRVYLSSSLSEKDMNYIIAHEAAHLKRKDHWWKPLGYSLLCIYWFNPLCWAAYIMLCKDIELACDEKLAKNMTFLEKKEYSEVLLSYAQQRRMVIACPLAFGEVGVKERIKSILKYKKPKLWIMLAAIAVCVVTAVCFLTNPLNKADAETVSSKEDHEGNQPPENSSIQESQLNDTEHTTDSEEDDGYNNWRERDPEFFTEDYIDYSKHYSGNTSGNMQVKTNGKSFDEGAVTYRGGEVEINFTVTIETKARDHSMGYLVFIGGTPQILSLNGSEPSTMVIVEGKNGDTKEFTIRFTPRLTKENIADKDELELTVISISNPLYLTFGTAEHLDFEHRMGSTHIPFKLEGDCEITELVSGKSFENFTNRDSEVNKYFWMSPSKIEGESDTEETMPVWFELYSATKEKPVIQDGKADITLLLYGGKPTTTVPYKVYFYVNHEPVKVNDCDYITAELRYGFAAKYSMTMDNLKAGDIVYAIAIAENTSNLKGVDPWDLAKKTDTRRLFAAD